MSKLCPHDYLIRLGPRCLKCWHAKCESLESQLRAADELAKTVKEYRQEYAHITKSIEDRLRVGIALENALSAYEKARGVK